jgi:hypothetical protein
MFLADIFQYLSRGELSQFAVGTENSGRVSEDDYEQLITHINLGLNNLFSRLPIKQDQATVTQIAGQTLYTITGNILKIEEVYGETGIQYPLNDTSLDNSLFTPSSNTLQVPTPVDGAQLAVIYRAKHATIPAKRGIDPKSIVIDMPDILIEPLLAYVVSRVMQSRGTAESISEANAYMQKYEMLLQQAQISGLFTSDMPTNTKLRDNGWV